LNGSKKRRFVQAQGTLLQAVIYQKKEWERKQKNLSRLLLFLYIYIFTERYEWLRLDQRNVKMAKLMLFLNKYL
jgi:hypothetical protein